MTTKEKLRQYRNDIEHMRMEAYQLIESVNMMQARATKTTPGYSCEFHGTNGPHDGMAEIIARMADKEAEIIRKTILMDNLVQDVERIISSLNVTERVVLRAYYIDGMTWDKVSEFTHFSQRTTFRIHGMALQKL